MKKIIKEVDDKRGILQVTSADERWYLKPIPNKETGIPEYKAVPSVTWIAGFYPKGIQFYKWLSEKGWDEAEAAKQAAGDKGSAVHLAIEKILNGEEFKIDTQIKDKSRSTEQVEILRDLTFEELICVKSFCDWRNDLEESGRPLEVIATETTIFSEKYGYAGTIDLICRIGTLVYIVDFKTSKNIWREYELQISAYKEAVENGENIFYENGKQLDVSHLIMAILQVGYEKNKSGYKFTEIDDAFPLFLTAQQIWKREIGITTPGFLQKDFPLVLSRGIGKEIAPIEAIPESTPEEPLEVHEEKPLKRHKIKEN